MFNPFTLSFAAIFAAAAFTSPIASAADLVVYDLPSKYMNWAGLVAAYKNKTGVTPTLDLKNGSSTALAALKLEAANPQASAAYWSLDNAVDAKKTGVTQPFKVDRFNAIPASLKDPEYHWWGVATANIVIGVNTDVLKKRNLSAPKSWADLLDKRYAGLVCAMDPTWSGTASVFMYSMNFILGGTKTDFRPGFTYLKAFKANGQSYRTEIVAPRLAQGECPITVDAEGNILIEKSKGAPVEIVIPSEGIAAVPLGMSMAKGAPQADQAANFLNWVLSDEAQTIIAEAYFRPVIATAVPPKLAALFPKVERQVSFDLGHAATHVADLKRAFTKTVMQGGDVQAALSEIGLAGQ